MPAPEGRPAPLSTDMLMAYETLELLHEKRGRGMNTLDVLMAAAEGGVIGNARPVAMSAMTTGLVGTFLAVLHLATSSGGWHRQRPRRSHRGHPVGSGRRRPRLSGAAPFPLHGEGWLTAANPYGCRTGSAAGCESAPDAVGDGA